MISKKKTTVSALRQFLGISLEDFAVVIDKSPSTVASLESGRLKLSQKTASDIAGQTGVELEWLLSGKPKSEPYVLDDKGQRWPYSKAIFELTQAEITKYEDWDQDPEGAFVYGIVTILDWLSVHQKAVAEKNERLVCYLMRQFINSLVERFGKDDRAFLNVNADNLLLGQKGVWKFTTVDYRGVHLMLRGVKSSEQMEKACLEMLREVRAAQERENQENPNVPAS
jgi:transcriptional regulator with XRE-family HTH domain